MGIVPRKPHFDYFDAFLQIATYAEKEAHLLQQIFEDFDPSILHEQLDQMHEYENSADGVNHELYRAVAAEFITPIDRDDILSLTQELDEVCDHVEDILQYVYMLNIQTIIPAGLEMARIIVRGTEALRAAAVEFPNFKKSTTIRKLLIEVNDAEEAADKIYIEGMHKVYATSNDPLHVAQWTKLFDRLERACDACEHAAECMDSVVMKNT